MRLIGNWGRWSLIVGFGKRGGGGGGRMEGAGRGGDGEEISVGLRGWGVFMSGGMAWHGCMSTMIYVKTASASGTGIEISTCIIYTRVTIDQMTTTVAWTFEGCRYGMPITQNLSLLFQASPSTTHVFLHSTHS